MSRSSQIELTLEFESGYETAVFLDLPLNDNSDWWTAITSDCSNDDVVAVWLGPAWRSSLVDPALRVPLDEDGEWCARVKEYAEDELIRRANAHPVTAEKH